MVNAVGICPDTLQPLSLDLFTASRNSSGFKVLSVILIKSTFSFSNESSAASNSSSVPISRSPGQIDSIPSNLGPEVRIFGPNLSPALISSLHFKTSKLMSPAASLTVVTPKAKYKGNSCSFSSTYSAPPK